jgi:serine/threonine protein kinase
MTRESIDEKEVFNNARRLAVLEERVTYLQQVCGHEPKVLHRILELLNVYFQDSNFLESPAVAPGVTLDTPAEAPGTLIGPYKLLEQIGEGGMGLVFMAEQSRPVCRRVALKVIKPGMDTRQVVVRFEAERQALALMDHPNIAKVFDGGTTDSGRPYFVMELVRGTPITDYCDARRLSTRQRLELFLDVCRAVQHAHHKGIIHRDLKPSNVLISIHDVTPVVKVIDFGVAKATAGQLTDKSVHTQLTQLIGTPLYMSPEQAGLSDLDVDTRSDIYSLGVLLYELLVGTTPFDKARFQEAGYDELRRIIREEEPLKPSTRLSTLSQAETMASSQRQNDPKLLSQLLRGELDWIAMKCLDKDRNRRYQTAGALAADVGHYLNDEVVEARPPSAWYRLRKLSRRHKQALAATAGVLLLLTVLASALANQWIEADRRSQAIGTILEKASGLRQQGRLSAARVVLEQARESLGETGPADLRRRLEQASADLDLVDRLESIRLRLAILADKGWFDTASAERVYAAALQEAGLAEEGEDVEVVAARIRGSEVREFQGRGES